MTREEHQAILAFVEQTVSGKQPPMDVEADAIIRALFVRNPDAAYRITMLAMSLAGKTEDAALNGLPEGKAPRKGWLGGIFERLAPVRAETVQTAS